MSREVLFFISSSGDVLFQTTDDNAGFVDGNKLWHLLYKYRNGIKYIVHSHPGSGAPRPSHEDLSTFKSMGYAGFAHVEWVIITRDYVHSFDRDGVQIESSFPPLPKWLHELRVLSYT